MCINLEKFDGLTRMRLIEIIVEAKKSDETIEAVDKIEEYLLIPRDKRCNHCLNQNSEVILNVETIPKC